jgi:hypothetical protein
MLKKVTEKIGVWARGRGRIGCSRLRMPIADKDMTNGK